MLNHLHPIHLRHGLDPHALAGARAQDDGGIEISAFSFCSAPATITLAPSAAVFRMSLRDEREASEVTVQVLTTTKSTS